MRFIDIIHPERATRQLSDNIAADAWLQFQQLRRSLDPRRHHLPVRPAETAPAFASPPQREHAGDDWSDAGLGPNRASTGRSGSPATTSSKRLRLRQPFVVDAVVAQRFNAYARAAHPSEIGGLLRIVEQPDHSLRVVDVRIFPHVAASGGYFELDGAAVAQFNMDLVLRGRAHEVPEWCSLIHSHPNMTPFLSGTDSVNVRRLAGDGRAFSLIVATSVAPEGNYHALHYAQGGPVPLVATYLPVYSDQDYSLAGTDLLLPEEIQLIEDEVVEAFARIRHRC